MRSSPEREGEINFGAVSEQKPLTRNKEGETAVKSGREDAANMEPEQKRAKVTAEEGNLERKPVVINKEIKINFHGLDLEKERDVKLNPDAQKTQQPQQQPKPVKDEQPHSEKIGKLKILNWGSLFADSVFPNLAIDPLLEFTVRSLSVKQSVLVWDSWLCRFCSRS